MHIHWMKWETCSKKWGCSIYLWNVKLNYHVTWMSWSPKVLPPAIAISASRLVLNWRTTELLSSTSTISRISPNLIKITWRLENIYTNYFLGITTQWVHTTCLLNPLITASLSSVSKPAILSLDGRRSTLVAKEAGDPPPRPPEKDWEWNHVVLESSPLTLTKRQHCSSLVRLLTPFCPVGFLPP